MKLIGARGQRSLLHKIAVGVEEGGDRGEATRGTLAGEATVNGREDVCRVWC